MSNKAINEKKSQQLGIPVGTATSKLRLKVIFDLLKYFNCNICYNCKNEICCSEDLSLNHLEHWLDKNPALFWSSNNITFRHRNCDSAQLKENKMIETTLVNKNNKPFKVYSHEGKTYFEGVKGKQYGIKIKNTSSSRLEVVVTVDGRDIISGENGNYKTQRGYILNPFEETIIKGFRQNKKEVASFVFNKKEDSYSELMGTPENVGVIGIAVFNEEPKPLNIIINKETIKYIPYYPNLIPVPWNPWNPYATDPYHPWWYTQDRYTMCGGTSTAVYSSTENYSSEIKEIKTSSDLNLLRQNIGTEYGETLQSSIENTIFKREKSEIPNHLLIFYYDDYEGLKARGVVNEIKQTNNPQPFPAISNVEPGFAKPPIKHQI